MIQLNIQLSEKVKAAAESRAAQGRCTVDAYLESLIVADTAEEFGGPPHLHVDSQETLVALLREGEQSPAHEMKSRDWDALRQRLIAEHTPSKAG